MSNIFENAYLNKYKSDNPEQRRSVYDILSLDTEKDWGVIKERYVATDIDKVVIGGNTFKNYGDFQFAWEKSYVKTPERSANGSIGNLNSYSTFNTPHLIINFGLMSIDDYRAIMLLDLAQNEFVVECYDPIYNKKFKGKMYFGTPQMAKLFKIAKIRYDENRWEEFVELVGVQEYTVELIGTNADLDLVSVTYHLNPPISVADETQAEQDVYKGEDVIIGSNTDFPSRTFDGRYKFTKWNTAVGEPLVKKDFGNYIDGYAYTINENLVLYAQWEEVTDHVLNFSYGVADAQTANNSVTYPTRRYVKTGEGIGNLPTFPQNPVVKYNEEEYTPYLNGAWYKTPVKAENSQPVNNNEPYWVEADATIYLLYDVAKYYLRLYVEEGSFNSLKQYQQVEYNSTIVLPTYEKQGYKFDGWYKDELFQEKFKETKMPPKDTTLYARWVDG